MKAVNFENIYNVKLSLLHCVNQNFFISHKEKSVNAEHKFKIIGQFLNILAKRDIEIWTYSE